jgi:hypothetical protein
MGYRLLTQGILIIASLVIVFSVIQPALERIKVKQSELQQYTDTINRAAQFNAKLRELIGRRDSFSRQDMQSLEKFIPTQIDSLRIMSEIAGIFSSRGIRVNSMVAGDIANPMTNFAFEDSILARQMQPHMNLSYQDYEVVFVSTYEEMREILMLTESSNSLFEIVDLTFEVGGSASVNRQGAVVPTLQRQDDMLTIKIVFRTFGLPVNTNI